MALPLEFGRPIVLWLLVALVPIVYLAWTTRAPLRGLRWWLATVARVVLILLITACAADVRWSRRTNELCVYFLVDGSRSTGPRALATAETRIRAQVAEMGKDDRFGVIVFGQRPRLQRAMGPAGPVELRPLDPRVAEFTNIGRAIRYAASQFPQGCQRRIVLLSDGNENLGQAEAEARAAGAADVDIVAAPLSVPHETEVLVESVQVPARARPLQPIDVRAAVRASRPTEATVKLFRDGEPLASGQIMLDEGTNLVPLVTDGVSEAGFHRYEVIVEPAAGADTVSLNNTALGYTQVYGEARVLYLEGMTEHAARLARALRSGADRLKGGFDLEVGGPQDVPVSLEEMGRYDCIILSDVPSSAMTSAQMQSLKRYVEQLGGGLVMIGGEKSLTTGGYLDTPVEDALPVSLHLERERHLASLALAIVIDQSGSMGAPAAGGAATKMDLANQACANAIKLLQEYDEAGVCMTDTMPKWVTGRKVHPMTPGNRSQLIRDVLRARPGGGGIFVKTGIDAAYRELKKSSAQTRHVILFADAQDSEQQNGCYEMARRMLAQHRITLTAVGLGVRGDPDVRFLKTLSEVHGSGRFYLTNRATDLPEIFAKDTYIVSRNAIVEVPEGFRPSRVSGAEAIRNIRWEAVPPLYGYVATVPSKPGAEVLLTAVDDEPLLARWRFGLGKATVFTSDAKARWAKAWTAWRDFDRFWAQIVRWTMRETSRGSVQTQVALDGNRGRVLVDAIDAEGRFINGRMLTARVITSDPEVEPETVTLHQAGPGRYAGDFDLKATGVAYQVIVVDEQQGGAIVDSVGAVLSYAPEYRDLAPDRPALVALAEAAGGRYTDEPLGVFERTRPPVSALRSVWVPLLATALGLLVLDVATRRLVLPDWLTRRRKELQRKATDGADAAVAHLRQTRDQLRQRREAFDSPTGEADADAPDPTLAASLLREKPGKDSAAGASFLAADDDDVVPLQRAGRSDEDRDDAPPSATEQLLAARRRARRRTDENQSE